MENICGMNCLSDNIINKYIINKIIVEYIKEQIKNNIFATIKVNNKTVISGKRTPIINLKTGNNIITIVVTSQNRTTKTYVLTINRSRTIRSKNIILPKPLLLLQKRIITTI